MFVLICGRAVARLNSSVRPLEKAHTATRGNPDWRDDHANSFVRGDCIGGRWSRRLCAGKAPLSLQHHSYVHVGRHEHGLADWPSTCSVSTLRPSCSIIQNKARPHWFIVIARSLRGRLFLRLSTWLLVAGQRPNNSFKPRPLRGSA